MEVEPRLLCSSSAWELILGSLPSSGSLLVFVWLYAWSRSCPTFLPPDPRSSRAVALLPSEGTRHRLG